MATEFIISDPYLNSDKTGDLPRQLTCRPKDIVAFEVTEFRDRFENQVCDFSIHLRSGQTIITSLTDQNTIMKLADDLDLAVSDPVTCNDLS